uniref:Uncharacterized protein n=1 Tax=Globodera rostochiensis TaxID=31243 RepID=A0A914HMS1_GLORO
MSNDSMPTIPAVPMPITITTTTTPTTTTTTTTTVFDINRVAAKCGTSFSFAACSILASSNPDDCQLVFAIACAMSVEVHLDAI